MSASEASQLSLKVMRMALPRFLISQSPAATLTLDDSDLLTNPHASASPPSPSSTSFKPPVTATQQIPIVYASGVQALSFSPALAIPTVPKDDFVGETFAVYLLIRNHSDESLSNVFAKVELQTQAKKWLMFDNISTPLPKLDAGQNLEVHGREKLVEAGTHLLVCFFGYTSRAGEKKMAQKFFRFQVSTPFSIESTVLPTSNGHVVQAKVTNISTKPFYVESISLDSPLPYTNLSAPSQDPSPFAASHMTYIKPQAAQQMLYAFAPNPSQPILSFGQLRIVWRTALGERGELSGEMISNPFDTQRSISLSVTSAPQRVHVEHLFHVTFSLSNRSDKALTPHLLGLLGDGRDRPACMLIGHAQQRLADVPAGGQGEFTLQFVPLRAGLLQLGGLRVQDALGGRVHEFKDLLEVYAIKDA